jgi:acyl carrier protein phosphodiesterase
VDLLESIYIDRYWDSLLNTTRSNLVPDYDKELLLEYVHLLEHSTSDHIRTLIARVNDLNAAEERYEELLNIDEFISNLLAEKESIEYSNELNKAEVARLKNRGFFERLFNT